jgi:hypothetical protein
MVQTLERETTTQDNYSETIDKNHFYIYLGVFCTGKI